MILDSLNMLPGRLVHPDSWVMHIPFAFLIIKILKPSTLVELGVHTGNSFSAFCQSAQKIDHVMKAYGIDTFQGEKHAGFYDESIYNDIHDYLNTNHPGMAELIRDTFDSAKDRFADQSIDLLHIDGLHTYEAVKHDFETWLPKVSNKGMILFHDTQVKRDDFGVWKFWEELSSRYHHLFEFSYGNGLGVLCLDSNPFTEFLSEMDGMSLEEFLKPSAEHMKTMYALQDHKKHCEATIESYRSNSMEKSTLLVFLEDGSQQNLVKEYRIGLDDFDEEFDLSQLGEVSHMRWDPSERSGCEVAIESLEIIPETGDAIRPEIGTLGHNGKLEGSSKFVFLTLDPNIHLEFSGNIKSLRIAGKRTYIPEHTVEENYKTKINTFRIRHHLPDEIFSQVYLNLGKGYTEDDSIRLEYVPDQTNLTFDLSLFQNIQSIRFDPLNIPCGITIQSINLETENGKFPIHFYSNNAFQVEKMDYKFLTIDPWFELKKLPASLAGKKIHRLVIELRYTFIGYELLETMEKLSAPRTNRMRNFFS